MQFNNLFFCLLLCSPVYSSERLALYNSLEPTSIVQHLAFYELYKDTEEGKHALSDAWALVSQGAIDPKQLSPLAFPAQIDFILQLINPNSKNTKDGFEISEEALNCIEQLAKNLPNRTLQGYTVTEEKELFALKSEEIDIGRALFLLQLGNDLKKRRSYEAALDLMALQVLARVSLDATPEEKIRVLNRLIFYELGFRFPPHSTYSDSIDHFTFLPSVLESRRGVCLGVSVLYLSIAQRINLPLEIVTPPGHIFLRYKNINIETTARGIHLPSDEYFGVNTKKLKMRSLKEVLGMVSINQASLFLSRGEWQKAASTYEKALPFMPEDILLKELLGCSYLLSGKEKEGKKLLSAILKMTDEESICKDTLAEDIIQKNVSIDCLPPLFVHVDETRKSIEEKKNALIAIIKKCPQFRSAHFQLATCYLQLTRPQEAIATLKILHKIDPNDINCEYYLAALSHERFDDPTSWKHFYRAKEIAAAHKLFPRPLKELQITLSASSPTD